MKNKHIIALIPILFGFFVMGFCDVVGIATNFVSTDFAGVLPKEMFGFLPSVVFLWFLFLSVPCAMMMNKIGRKSTVLLSMVITFVGMMVPFVAYNIVTCLIGFAMLGIGNTILQVSLNPLVSNVVMGDKLSSALTGGQVVKAISSFCGPFIALFAAQMFGSWQYLFPIFAVITLLSGVWLIMTPIEMETQNPKASIGATFSLLGDKTILLCFLGIVAVVGIDVGMNTESASLLMERLGLDSSLRESVEQVSHAPSVYFLCRTIGAFIGTALLAKISSLVYFKINMICALISLAALFFVSGEWAVLGFVGAVGFFCSSIFSVIFSKALQARPTYANEISGLMITGVFGGAIVPPLMSYSAKWMGSESGALIILVATALYLTVLAFSLKSAKSK